MNGPRAIREIQVTASGPIIRLQRMPTAMFISRGSDERRAGCRPGTGVFNLTQVNSNYDDVYIIK